MNEFIQPVLVLIVMIALLYVLLVVRQHLADRAMREITPAEYENRGSLLTVAERSYFGALRQLCGKEMYVVPKVRLTDIIQPVDVGPAGDLAFSRIDHQYIDFVLCEPDTMQVRCCIALEDPSRERVHGRKLDNVANNALSAAQIPLVSVPVKRCYSIAEVRESILSALPAEMNMSANRRYQADFLVERGLEA